MVQVTDTHGFDFSAYSSDDSIVKSGFRFSTNLDLHVISLNLNNQCGATKAYILDSGKNVLYSADVVSFVATFTNANLNNTTTYYMCVDKNGNSYPRPLNYDDQTYPQNRTNINYTGALDGTDDTLKAFNIDSITTEEGLIIIPSINVPTIVLGGWWEEKKKIKKKESVVKVMQQDPLISNLNLSIQKSRSAIF